MFCDAWSSLLSSDNVTKLKKLDLSEMMGLFLYIVFSKPCKRVVFDDLIGHYIQPNQSPVRGGDEVGFCATPQSSDQRFYDLS